MRPQKTPEAPAAIGATTGLAIGLREFVTLIAMLTALSALASDVMLP